MKKSISLFLIFLFCVSGMQSYGAEYVFDKPGQHVFITFKASHLGYSYILGHFEDFDGAFAYDSDKPEDSTVQVTIAAKAWIQIMQNATSTFVGRSIWTLILTRRSHSPAAVTPEARPVE